MVVRSKKKATSGQNPARGEAQGKAAREPPAPKTIDALSQEEVAQRVRLVTAALVRKLHPRRAAKIRVRLDSRLDRDLGLDSLGRVELLFRLEHAFRVRLSETLLGRAETLRDLTEAISKAEASPAGRAAPSPALEALPPAAVPEDARTLTEALDWHAAAHPDRPHVVLAGLDEDETVVTYGDLAESAREVGCALRRRGLEPGDRVAIMLPTGAAFFQAFFGALYAGGIPVPIYPPLRRAQIEEHLRRQARILQNAGPAVLIAEAETRQVSGLLRAQVSSLTSVESVEALRAEGYGRLPSGFPPDATALIQYTSGSTGDPKGVVLSHANLMSNIRAMGEVIEAGASDVFVSWLPLYHDMGLIGAWLGSLYYGALAVIMSPLSFLARPERWFQAIHRHRGTLSAAPNFAFELCLRRIDDSSIEGLDLSSLRFVANGAEPVSPETLRRFTDRFAKFGFRPEAMAPVYGLAENSVGLAFPPLGRAPVIDRVRRQPLAESGEAIPAGSDDRDAAEFAASGRPLPGHEVRLVDETRREVGERHQGRLQFRGASATRGYFENEAKTRELFDGQWLDSGDLAYIAGGDVFITGRSKDIVIRAGRNIYPQEVEEAVGALEGVRKGCVAVFGSLEPASGTERLVVLAETRKTRPADLEALRGRVVETTLEILEDPPDEIVLAPPRTVPKTSSGKLRRSAARELYESGGIGGKPRALWLQVLRLTLASVIPRARRRLHILRELAFAGWWWGIVGIAVGIVWPLVMIAPSQRRRWTILHHCARWTLPLAGTRLSVEGLEHLPADGAIVVSNHASYLDGAVLAAALPSPLAFVAKRELAGQFFAGNFLRRIAAIFVERSDPAASVEDTDMILTAVGAGHRPLFFAEGTLMRSPGLMPFHLGAFVIAARTMTPVVPVTITGTRSILRGDQWFPRRGSVRLVVDPAITPDGKDFDAAVRLRDAARAKILERCGEPDLAQ